MSREEIERYWRNFIIKDLARIQHLLQFYVNRFNEEESIKAWRNIVLNININLFSMVQNNKELVASVLSELPELILKELKIIVPEEVKPGLTDTDFEGCTQ